MNLPGFPPPGRLAATARIPDSWCELLHTTNLEFPAVIVITNSSGKSLWWAYRSRFRARWSFWMLRIQHWPTGWDYEHRSRRLRQPDGRLVLDREIAASLASPSASGLAETL